MTYLELLNVAPNVEDYQASIKESIAARGEFLGMGSFRHRGDDRVVPYDQASKGRSKGSSRRIQRQRCQEVGGF